MTNHETSTDERFWNYSIHFCRYLGHKDGQWEVYQTNNNGDPISRHQTWQDALTAITKYHNDDLANH